MYHICWKLALNYCSDTVSRVGVFCSVVNAIEMCKTEGVVDVFQIVKALRIQKPGTVPTMVKMLYACMIQLTCKNDYLS